MIDQQSEAGFTYHYVDEGCDTGRILLQKKIEILPFDTQATLYMRVAMQAMDYFNDALNLVMQGVPGTPQIGEASHFPRGCPFDGKIDPEWSDDKIEVFIRAMIHPPYPPATYAGQEVFTFAQYKNLRSQSDR